MRKIKLIGLALVVAIAGMVFVADPASASTCAIYGWQNPGGSNAIYTPQTVNRFYIPANQGSSIVYYRSFCYVVGVITQPDGYTFQYAARVQDTVEQSANDSVWLVDDLGSVYVRSNTPGTTTWNTRSLDQISSDYYFGNNNITWYSPWYDARVVGNPENYLKFRIDYDTHNKCLPNCNWTYTSVSGNSFTVHG